MKTHVEGDPSTIEAAADFLRIAVADGARDYGDAVAAQRNALEAAWQGESGSAFGVQATALAVAADRLAATAASSADELDVMAAALRNAQDGMHELRDRAVAAGLSVVGTDILPPLLSSLDPSRGFVDQPPLIAHEVYASLAVRHEQILQTWEAGLDAAAVTLLSSAESLALVGANLLSVAFSPSLLEVHHLIMARQSASLAGEADRLAQQAAHHVLLMREGRLPVGYSEYDDLLSRSAAAREASQAVTDAPDPRFPGRLGTSLGVLTTGFGVYADIQAGESPAQAVGSQGAGLAASAATMALLGTSFGPVGTVGGVLLALSAGIAADKGADRLAEKFRHHDNPPTRPSTRAETTLGPEEARIARLMGAGDFVPPKMSPAP